MKPDIALVIILVVLAIAAVQWLGLSIQKQLGGISRLDAKLDLLLKQAGLEFDPYKNVPSSVIDAVRRGNKIEAIKNYRAATGVGLKEAKDAVEEIQQRAGA
jgi:ribosomal protein L7/L12